MKSFIGVVLAGGRSRRMGKDKSQLIRVEQTMLAFTKQQLMAAGATEVVVSVAHDQTEGIADVQQDLGPLAGIHAVLKRNPELPHLFVPVDLPFLNPKTLQRLAETGLQQQVSTCYLNQPIPVFIYPDSSVIDLLDFTLSEQTDLSLFRFNRKNKTLVLTPDEEDNWFNANTPAQWQQALDIIALA